MYSYCKQILAVHYCQSINFRLMVIKIDVVKIIVMNMTVRILMRGSRMKTKRVIRTRMPIKNACMVTLAWTSKMKRYINISKELTLNREECCVRNVLLPM